MLQELSSGTSYVQFHGTVFLLEVIPINEVKRLFPNLKKLNVLIRVGVDEKTANYIAYIANFCTQFPSLESLTLTSFGYNSSWEAARIQPDLWVLATAISQLSKISDLHLPLFPFTEAQSCRIVAGLPHLQIFEPPRFSAPETFFGLAQKPELKYLFFIDLSQFQKVVELCRNPVLFPSLQGMIIFRLPLPVEDDQLEYDQLKRKLARSRPNVRISE